MPTQSNLAIRIKTLSVPRLGPVQEGARCYKGHYWAKLKMWTDQTKYSINVKFPEVDNCAVVTYKKILILRKYTRKYASWFFLPLGHEPWAHLAQHQQERVMSKVLGQQQAATPGTEAPRPAVTTGLAPVTTEGLGEKRPEGRVSKASFATAVGAPGCPGTCSACSMADVFMVYSPLCIPWWIPLNLRKRIHTHTHNRWIRVKSIWMFSVLLLQLFSKFKIIPK